MLIDWVYDSVARCFAKSYEITSKIGAPPEKKLLLVSAQPAPKPSCGQFAATEIRAAARGKSGMAFEVILADVPVGLTPPKRPNSPPKTPVSIDDIMNKLKAAEERRQSLESQRLIQLADRWNKVEVVSQKKAEFNDHFANQTKEQLNKKMESITENRESYINASLAKLKEHEDRVLEVRKTVETQICEIKENIDKKLAVASENREEKIQKKLEKLKEHEEIIQKVRRLNEEKLQQLGERIEHKLELAQENREAVLQRKIEHLKEHDRRIEEVRQNKQQQENADEKSG